jgi:flavin-dependent dehydrogenase
LVPPGTSLQLASRVAVREATASERSSVISEGIVRVGDAAFAQDPLSSQGLQYALVSAGQAAIVINTILVHMENAALAQDFYRLRHDEAVRHHQAACATLYGRQDQFDTMFWRERQGPIPAAPSVLADAEWPYESSEILHASLILSAEARWQQTAVITGDFIEKSPGAASSVAAAAYRLS